MRFSFAKLHFASSTFESIIPPFYSKKMNVFTKKMRFLMKSTIFLQKP